ncbi:MAG: NAD(P)H-dependent oxidoreductase subunit E [Gammaproteobacteria bacterium]
MSYYKKHLFFCVNQRKPGKKCCAQADAEAMRDYVKQRLKKLGLVGDSGIRVNTAGCLGRCAEGPILVIYPEGVWYTYHNKVDLDEIIEQHILRDCQVERLLLPSNVARTADSE